MVENYPPLDKRPIANTIALFDVDDTLTIPRRVCPSTPPPGTSFANDSSARQSRNAPTPPLPPPENGHRLRWRIRPGQTARTTWHRFHPRNQPLRLLLRGKWAHSLQARGPLSLPLIHQMVGRTKIQGVGQVYLALCG